MNLLLTLSIILITSIITKDAFSEWKLVSKASDGNEYYVDHDKTRVVNEYVFYWYLSNFVKPIKGIKSASNFAQGDCKLMRFKRVSIKVFKKPMGQELLGSRAHTQKDWDYPRSNSSMENILKSVCNN